MTPRATAFARPLAGMVLAALLCAAWGRGAPAQSAQPAGKTDARELVAVLDFEAIGANKNQVAALTERLREELLQSGRYRLVERAQMDKILEEQALQQTGCTSQECAVQVGKVLGVRKLVSGKINKVEDDLWLLSATLVDVESAETLRAVSVQHEGAFRTLLATGMGSLAAKLTGGAAAAAAPAAAVAAQPPTPTRAAGSAAILVEGVTSDVEIWLNGSRKGMGVMELNGLVPGQYTLEARRQGKRPWKQTLLVAEGAALKVTPEPGPYRLAVFPIYRTGSWPAKEPQSHTDNWVGRGIHGGVAGDSSYKISHSFMPGGTGIESIGNTAFIRDGAWSAFGNPKNEFVLQRIKDLDVDAALLVRVQTGNTSTTGMYKLWLLEAGGRAVETSGSWPYKDGSGGIRTAVWKFLGSLRLAGS
jgi:TolB-like protein